MFLVYSFRDGKLKSRIILYSIYLLYIICLFAGFLFFVSYGNEFDTEVLFWGIKWICYFLIITIIQHFSYHFFGKGKDGKLLIVNIVIVFVMGWLALKMLLVQ